MTLAVLAMRVHLADAPLDRDTTNYSVLAREWGAGRPLYTDLWLHSPPGIVWAYRIIQAMVGNGPQEMFALGFACACGTLLAVYAATTAVAGRVAGLWAALYWTIFSGSLPLQFNLPSCEVVMALCLAGALALLLWPWKSERAWWWAIVAAGLLLALDSLVKQVTLPLTVAVAAAILIWPPAEVSRRRAMGGALVVLGVSAIAWFALLLRLFSSGALPAFWETNVAFNMVYSRGSGSAGMLANMLRSLKPPTRIERPYFDLRWVLLMLAASTALACMPRFTLTRYNRGLLLASAAGSFLAIALPGNFYEHYFQLGAANICIAMGVVAAGFSSSISAKAVYAALAAVLAVVNDRAYLSPAAQWPRLQMLDDKDNAIQAMSSVVSSLLKPGETVFDWGDDPQFYFYTGARPPTGFLFSATVLLNPRFQGPWSVREHEQALRDLKANLPELLVVYTVDDISAGDPTVGRWLKDNYQRRPETIGYIALYERISGRLATEAGNHAN